ncbi:bifunctional biotin--[acetyl-CoA-carboxylase] ligase/biotin operon repressor BirA [Thiolapillus sp.]
MNAGEYQLLKVLGDAKFHSGEALAGRFSVSRAAIWKRVRNLNQVPGIDIQSVRGKGYCLPAPLDLLDADAILARIGPARRSRLLKLALLPVVPSTNEYLLNQRNPLLHSGHACVAEHQTAGRGRRGRQWVSVFGNNVYLSLAWRFDLSMADLAGLSIAAGVAVARALAARGLRGHGLKWPNDVHVQGKKLAGILVEANGEMEGPCLAVIGIGLNVRLPASAGGDIDQPWTDLAACLASLPDRNALVGDLLGALVDVCIQYQQQGLAPFLEAWKEYDIYMGKPVELQVGDERITGVYAGLSDQGGLVLDSPAGRRTWYSGEVSLRSKT